MYCISQQVVVRVSNDCTGMLLPKMGQGVGWIIDRQGAADHEVAVGNSEEN